jgi:hypothetical protein
VLVVTTADILPAIEAAIAHRIERDISADLKDLYAGSAWGFTGTNHVLPYAAPYAVPFADPALNAMRGVAGTYRGFLPMVYAETSPGSGVLCTPTGATPRCAPDFVAWSSANMAGSAATYAAACSTVATKITCGFSYRVCVVTSVCGTSATVPFTVNATASNVAMALRRLSTSTTGTAKISSLTSLTAVMNPNGSATIALGGLAAISPGDATVADAVCALAVADQANFDCRSTTVEIPITVFADHPILSSGTTGWFARNRWHELIHYSVATGFTAATLPATPSCSDGSTCLSIANLAPTGKQRAIFVLAGRSINGSARPGATLNDYLEFGNVAGNYERRPMSTGVAIAAAGRFNDRIISIDQNP